MLEHIINGGTIMVPLLLLSILAFAVIIDRMRVFKAAEKNVQSLRTEKCIIFLRTLQNFRLYSSLKNFNIDTNYADNEQ